MNANARPYLPIAVGFHLLALPLLVAIVIEPGTVGRVTNGIAALVMVGLGLLLQRSSK